MSKSKLLLCLYVAFIIIGFLVILNSVELGNKITLNYVENDYISKGIYQNNNIFIIFLEHNINIIKITGIMILIISNILLIIKK